MPRHEYDTYTLSDLNREFFDGIEVGDYVKINDWRRGMRVYGVSENYILAATKSFNGQWAYSIIKKVFRAGQFTNASKNSFICGPDDRVFGFRHQHAYEFDNEDFVQKYLKGLEEQRIGLSHMAVPIREVRLRRKST